ncbi:MAG TPA: hypothetical protein VGH16_16070 [Candidatus Binatia bacterium]
MLWLSLALGLLKAPTHLSDTRQGSTTFVVSLLVFTFAFLAFMIFKISTRKNWARIAFLVLFAIGTLPTVAIFFDEFARTPIVGVLTLAQIVVQLYSLFLLFTPSANAWFRKRAPVDISMSVPA